MHGNEIARLLYQGHGVDLHLKGVLVVYGCVLTFCYSKVGRKKSGRDHDRL